MVLMYIEHNGCCFAEFLGNAKCLCCSILCVAEFYIQPHNLCVCTEWAISLVPNETAKIMNLILAFSELFLIDFFE